METDGNIKTTVVNEFQAIPVYAMKHVGSGFITPLILNLGIRWR
jgi:hypothetical protein